ncbi:hypothetical protein M413DRAFT_439199 [Hebeloma cylindrosporum]|uniref:Uncharacterized protein n=1 Tax=Hebeloma cylindrosporum TaxID=76867 RepID=A0A0C2Z2N5_HEBCY|nr:hypothetical protein M413DRAFT_439199 [Hebeloma cylindrosporum h7]
MSPPSAASFLDIDKDVLLPVVSSISLPDTSNVVQHLIQRQASEPQTENLSVNHTQNLTIKPQSNSSC